MIDSKDIIASVKGAAAAILLLSFAMVVTLTTPTFTAMASAQIPAADRIFESEEDGFRLQIPQGWVIQDDIRAVHPTTNIEGIAMLCQENEALLGIQGQFNCQAANLTDAIYINRWPDLPSMPEFQNDSEIIITTNDLVALWIQALQNDTTDIHIENTTDIDEFTRIVNMAYTYNDKAGTFLPFDDITYGVNSAIMFVLSQDRNRGYIINNNVVTDNQTRQHSPAVQEVFDSFEQLEQGQQP
jgi:hypothetical protein